MKISLILTVLLCAAFAVGNNPGQSTATSDASNAPSVRPYDFNLAPGTGNGGNSRPTVLMTHGAPLKSVSRPKSTAEPAATNVHVHSDDELPLKKSRPGMPQPIPEIIELSDDEADQSNSKISTTDPVDEIFDHNEYIEHQYEYLNPQSASIPMVGTDTPSVISNQLLKQQQNNIVAIVGETGSGKTTALKKILSTLRSIPSDYSSTLLDANELMPEKPPANWQTLLSNKLFEKVSNGATGKVNVLIDNIDKLPSYTIQETISWLNKIQNGGGGIVFTSSNNNPIINAVVKPENKMRISQLNAREIELFLTLQWDKKLNLENHRAHVEYAKAVAAVVEKTPLFKNFATMTQLGKILATNDIKTTVTLDEGISYTVVAVGDISHRVFDDGRDFQSVTQYADSGASDPIVLIEMLKETKFNKLGLTETLVSPLIKNYQSYAVPALEHVLRSEVSGTPLYEPLKLIREKNNYPTKRITDLLWHENNADFLAARYLLDYVQQGEQRIIPAIGELMTNPAYTNLVEYFNAALNDNGMIEKFEPVFKHIVNQGNERWHKILDNAISYGYDEIAAGLFKAVDSTEKISEYFQNTVDEARRTYLKSTTENRLGMQTEVKMSIQTNRQEMLFRKNMKKAILLLSKFEEPKAGAKYEMWRPRELINYLNDFYLCQSRPDIDIYTTMRNYEKNILGTERLSVDQANNRLYKIIKYSDIRSRPIIDELVSTGAIPKHVGNANSETLVHLAVAKRDNVLLNYIMNSLKVPITDEMGTLLTTALDSNPLPFHSQPRFWAMMYTLISSNRLRVPVEVEGYIDNIVPTAADRTSPAYKLITGADSVTLDDARSHLMVSNDPIEQLSPDLRSYRRRAILSNLHSQLFKKYQRTDNKKPLAEVILKYRGLDTYLSPREQIFYEKTLVKVLESNINKQVPRRHETYLANCLLSTVATNYDYFFVKHIIDDFIIKYGRDNRGQLWKEKLLQLEQQWNREPTTRFSSVVYNLKSGIMLERATWLRKALDLQIESAYRQKQTPRNKILHGLLGAGSSECGQFQRQRRSVTNCLISKEEYNQIVKITEENGREIPIIDTKEFMKRVDEWEFKHESKYKELIEVGKTLVERHGARLVGDYDHLVENRIDFHKVSDYDHIDDAAGSRIGLSGETGVDSEPFRQHESTPLSELSERTSQIHIHPLPSELPFTTHLSNVKSDIFKNPAKLPGEIFTRPYQLGRAPIIQPKVIYPMPEVFRATEIIRPHPEILRLPSIPRIINPAMPKIQYRFRGK